MFSGSPEQTLLLLRNRNTLANIWKPSQREVRRAVFEVLPQRKKLAFEVIDKTQEITAAELKLYRDQIQSALGFTPSAANLTCQFQMNNVNRQLEEVAQAELRRGNRLLFSLFADMVFAMDQVAGTIPLIELAGFTGIPVIQQERRKTLANIGVEVSQEQESTDISIWGTELIQGIALLAEDQSGKTLVRQLADRLKGLPNRFETLSPAPPSEHAVKAFISAGADLSVELYDRVYPIASKV